MGIKFQEICAFDPSSGPGRTYSQLLTSRRKHNYDINGRRVFLNSMEGNLLPIEQLSKFNHIVVCVKNAEGKYQEKVIWFHGNKLLLSNYQRRQFTPALRKQLAELGEKIFEEDSFYNLVLHTNNIRIAGSGAYVEDGQVLSATPQREAKKPSPQHITASDIYAYNYCEHLPWRNANCEPEEKDPLKEFIKLLMEKGVQHEEEVTEKLVGQYLDLSKGSEEKRLGATINAMESKVPLIYKGLMIVDELWAQPTLLKLMPDGQYFPVDIKAGMAYDGIDEDDDGKMKKTYAMQLGVYIDALNRLGFLDEHKGIILDIDGQMVIYDLDTFLTSRDKLTLWELYKKQREEVYALLQNLNQNYPALFSGCKLCRWYHACKDWCEENEHPSLVYKIGRTSSEVLKKDVKVRTVRDLAVLDVDQLLALKKAAGGQFLYGIGEGRLVPFVRRAKYLLSDAKGANILSPFGFPKNKRELHYDIEADPTQNIVYLHGVVEKIDNETKYHAFVADDISPEAEKLTFQKFWEYIRSLPDDYVVYHYGNYERTVCRQLHDKYPDVVSKEELENFFFDHKALHKMYPDLEDEEEINRLYDEKVRCLDLYSVIDQKTDWPLKSYSLKDIANLLGFRWRDIDPSGANSIKWFNDWVSSKDPQYLDRIKEYNEDDCRASLFVKEYLEAEMQNYMKSLEKQLEEPQLTHLV